MRPLLLPLLMQVDVEGFDVAAYFSMQRVLQEGKLPYASIEFGSRMANEVAKCDALRFVRHMHTLGYRCAR